MTRRLTQITDVVPEKFKPLVRLISGVSLMELVKYQGKSILLIGEIHQKNECREQGFVPMHEIIRNYLRTTNQVDFMFEMFPEYLNILRKNPPRTGSLLNKLRYTLSHFVSSGKGDTPKSTRFRSRIHWLDAYNPKASPRVTKKVSHVHAIIKLLFHVTFYSKPRVNPTDPEAELTPTAFINKMLTHLNALNPNFDSLFSVLYETPDGIDYVQIVGEDVLEKFIKYMIRVVYMSYRFKKCLKMDLDILYDSFSRIYLQIPLNKPFGFSRLLLLIQRFTLDMYACCRLMKRDDPWYKHIVVYAGERHIRSIRDILVSLGGTSDTLDLPFNPRCTPVA